MPFEHKTGYHATKGFIKYVGVRILLPLVEGTINAVSYIGRVIVLLGVSTILGVYVHSHLFVEGTTTAVSISDGLYSGFQPCVVSEPF